MKTEAEVREMFEHAIRVVESDAGGTGEPVGDAIRAAALGEVLGGADLDRVSRIVHAALDRWEARRKKRGGPFRVPRPAECVTVGPTIEAPRGIWTGPKP